MKKIALLLITVLGYLPLIANDICDNATSLTIGYNCLNFNDTNGTMAGASDEGTTLPSCAEGPASRASGNYDKWLIITSPPSGKMLLQLFTSGFIDEAVFYSGTCDALTEVGCFRDFSNPNIVQLNPNEIYYIRLNKSYPEDAEAFCIQLTEMPTNDICVDAISLTVGVECDGTFSNGDDRSATREDTITDCNGLSSIYYLDTWYSFEAPPSGRAVVKTSSEVGAAPDFKIYKGTCAALEEVFCGNAGYNVDSIVLVNPGEIYFIQTIATRSDSTYCISVKEQISFDNLHYGVQIKNGHSGTPTTLNYEQLASPAAVELEETGTCDQTAFARVEPAGVIKLKAVAPLCVEDSLAGKEPQASASGNWSMSRYRLIGLTTGVIPITFTFEFTGQLSLTPHDGNPSGAQCSFNFIYGFSNNDIAIQDNGGSLISQFGRQDVEFSIDNIEADAGTIDIQPTINDGSQTYNLDSIIPTFITAYNALPVAEKTAPTLILTEKFLTAINLPIDVTLWDTTLQKTLNAEATNFLTALDHLNFDNLLGYDSSAVSVSHLNYKHFIDYSYQRDLTVLMDNSDFNSLPTIWFNGNARALNINNPNTIISDFSNTGRLIRIRVPRESIINLDAITNVLQISQNIAIPIEVLECNDAKLVFSELPIDSGVFNSADSIIARSIIESEKEVVFKSEKVVILEAGFHAQVGSKLSVEIGEVPDCDASPLTSEGIEAIRNTKIAPAENVVIAEEIGLSVYPNPFNATTTIDYSLPDSAPVTIKIIDLFGQEKAILINNLVKESGKHRLTYNPNNLTNGMYFVIFKSGTTVKMKKIMLVK